MKFDVIIIGGSYAGLAAAMALGRALRKVLVIDGGQPCNRQTPQSHNFLTNDGKPPAEISGVAGSQVRQYPTVHFLDALATKVIPLENGFEVLANTGETCTSGKLILATGIADVMPDLPGFAECWGISVLHCPYCHGYEVRNTQTGILANGDMAYELAALIANWTADLTLYTNGKSTLSDQQLAKLQQHDIRVDDAIIAEISHRNGHLENILFVDGRKAPLKALYARLPFTQHSTIAEDLGCEMTTEGYIRIDAAQKTSVPGVYACGDNASRMRTVANAVAMGTTTGIMVNKALIEENF